MKKLLILLGAVALIFTLAPAEGKCNKDQKTEMKCDSGKCGEGNNTQKKVPAKGKCGQGKCG